MTMTPDITLCKGKGCPVRENCYRYKAKPSDYQSYFVEDFPCRDSVNDGRYHYFWAVKDNGKKD